MLAFLTRPCLMAVAAVLALTGTADAAEYAIADGSSLSYTVNHPMHEVVGTSTDLRLLKPIVYDPAAPTDFAGLAGIPMQADWKSFDSGNGNRDANTRLVVKASQFPQLTFVFESVQVKAETETVYTGTATGRMYVAGVKQPLTADVTIDTSDPQRIVVTSTAQLNMTDFGIEPPSLLLIKADEIVTLQAQLFFAPAQ